MKKKIIALLPLLPLYLFLYLPIISLFFNAFFKKIGTETTFSLEAFLALFSKSDIFIAVGHSFFIALLAIVIATIISIAGMLFYFYGGTSTIIMLFPFANIIIPEIVLAICLLIFFITTNISLGISTVTIAHSIVGIGYLFPLIYHRWQEIDKTIIFAAYDLGGSHARIFFTTILPLCMPSILNGALLFFIISIDNYLFAYFCNNVSFSTLSGVLLTQLRYGITDELCALSILLIMFSFIIGSVYIFCLHKGESGGTTPCTKE